MKKEQVVGGSNKHLTCLLGQIKNLSTKKSEEPKPKITIIACIMHGPKYVAFFINAVGRISANETSQIVN